MDDPMIPAVGKALALFARVVEGGGGRGANEIAALLALLGVVAAESDPRQGDILSLWASMVSNPPPDAR